MLALVLAVGLQLTGCGGGGGQQPVPDVQTDVPAPTYAADSTERFYFDRINGVRARLGLGLLAQNTRLDLAANHHADYLTALDHGSPGTEAMWLSGLEEASRPGYTGTTAQARCDAVGYAGGCGPSDGWINSYLEPTGVGPYLAVLALTQGAREIGLSRAIGPSVWNGPYAMRPYVQLGYPTGRPPQRQPAGFLLATALMGALHVQITQGEALVVDSFQVFDPAGQPVAGQVFTQATDPLQRVPAHAAMFVPTPAIGCPAGNYRLQVTGRRDSTPFSVDQVVALEPSTFCWW